MGLQSLHQLAFLFSKNTSTELSKQLVQVKEGISGAEGKQAGFLDLCSYTQVRFSLKWIQGAVTHTRALAGASPAGCTALQ